MPRPKGPGAIKFLDATKQDDVAMRRRLWRGAPGDTPLEEKLNDLYTERAKLTVQLIDLRTLREGLRRVVSGENPTMKKLRNPPMLRANAKMELPGVESKSNSAETALRSVEKQIEETQKQIKKQPRSRKAVFPWHERAVQLIMLHKFRHTTGDCVLSTHGATITTDELQKQLRGGFQHWRARVAALHAPVCCREQTGETNGFNFTIKAAICFVVVGSTRETQIEPRIARAKASRASGVNAGAIRRADS